MLCEEASSTFQTELPFELAREGWGKHVLFDTQIEMHHTVVGVRVMGRKCRKSR
jgi:hypothetical protein